jgi:hypothetical protein
MMVDNLFHDQADHIISQVFTTEIRLSNTVFLDLLLESINRPADGAPFQI